MSQNELDALQRARELRDEVRPLVGVIGAVSVLFANGMLWDKIGPLLHTKAVIDIANAHAKALVLVPAECLGSFLVVVALRLIVGPFDIRLRAGALTLRAGAAGAAVWLVCFLALVVAVQAMW